MPVYSGPLRALPVPNGLEDRSCLDMVANQNPAVQVVNLASH
jgi:hypothetical protein